MAIFIDIDLVSIVEAEPPDAYTVAFDVIYPGETWCRSVVDVEGALAAHLGREKLQVVRAARDALLELLALETVPVSFRLRVQAEGVSILARATPGA
jgi:hypothetical protein